MSEPMTLQEIADELGISRQMVYKIEQRALRKARALIQEQGLTLREILNDENCQIKTQASVAGSEEHGKVQSTEHTHRQKAEG